MFTLDGRMRFALALASVDEAQFKEKKLFEIVMSRREDGLFELAFLFDDAPGKESPQVPGTASAPANLEAGGDNLPEYVLVEEAQ